MSAISSRIQDHFKELRDPRRREPVYPLINLVTIAVCAVVCGADDFVAIAEHGEKKRKWLAQFLDLSKGISFARPLQRDLRRAQSGGV